MKRNPRYPLKHLSVRVPWHDSSWNGTVCSDPKSNSACLVLKNCSLNRDDAKEQSLCSKSIKSLDEKDFPVCVKESGAMMAPFEFYKQVSHPYVESSADTHGHLKPTSLRFPPYSACTIPYNWMLKKNCADYSNRYDLDFDLAREPELKWIKGDDKGWVQEYVNQKALLNCFYEHLEEEISLVIFYAKQVPFVESSNRVVTGIGRIKKIIPSDKYEGSNSRFAAAYWEHMVLHGIRPEMEDGFLLPYAAALDHAEQHRDFDPADVAVYAPDDKWGEFSYAAEHVSNDSVIRVLLECEKSLQKVSALGIGENNGRAISWIHDELQRIQKMRGAYPGMGAALCAFGIEKGHFVAAEIRNGLEDGDNAWTRFEQSLDTPGEILSETVYKLVPDNSKRLYKKYVENGSARLDLLHLLSRFDLSIEQAKRLFVDEDRQKVAPGLSDAGILQNPYLIYEANAKQPDSVALETIDLGLFLKNPPADLLPANTDPADPLNSFRIRALTFQELRSSTMLGHTLLPRPHLISKIRDKAIEPKCELNADYYELAEEVFEGVIDRVQMHDGGAAYQLSELAHCGAIIRRKVEARIAAAPLPISDVWESLLDDRLEKQKASADVERESRARVEKLAALRQLGESRFSVLIGPAGTGKTTLLTALASHPDIRKNGVLLLAPTGKARVRMEEMARDLSVTAKTLAQYLNSKGRFDGRLQIYRLSDQKDDSYETVILDEASMLTEEMLATTLDCLEKAKRFILVGDHRQLPPIGAGRPFVDIIARLGTEEIESSFPKVGPNYSELSVNMRTSRNHKEDLQLAEWFSGNALEVAADQVINEVIAGKKSDRLNVRTWKTPEEFESLFASTLIEELKIGELTNISAFNRSLGSADGTYFNNSNDAAYWKIAPSVNEIESWQILSPVRDRNHGVTNINRRIHQWFRSETVKDALVGRKTTYGDKEYSIRKIPKPVGPEQIVYGDKVINLANHRRDAYPSAEALGYIANGEIGLVTGQFKTKNAKYKGQPQYVEVEFSSQKGFVYTFRGWDFKEESEQPLELAYALTVHKAQGSEFGTVILVIPNPCFILSREMLYTALTRQRDRVVLLVQGDGFDIKEFSSPRYSDTLKRYTNLFRDPDPIEIEGVYFEKNLIHQASDGQMVRSKSELLIYQRLIDNDLSPSYEKKLILNEVEKLPDFTIDDPDTGESYYWEHCGMMNDPGYVDRWNAKRAWYIENEVLPWEDGGGKNGKLVVTYDRLTTLADGTARGAISIPEIDALISTVFQR